MSDEELASGNVKWTWVEPADVSEPAITVQMKIDAAVLEERERCAKVAAGVAWWEAGDIAALIRKGETP